MGWVVSSWRTERLAALVDAQARDAAREIVLAAERDARRIGRASARETADAVAYLEVLERLGEETLAAVRAQRGALKAPAPAAVPVPPDDGAGEEIRVARTPARRRRASMRDSPLGELFRATVTALD